MEILERCSAEYHDLHDELSSLQPLAVRKFTSAVDMHAAGVNDWSRNMLVCMTPYAKYYGNDHAPFIAAECMRSF